MAAMAAAMPSAAAVASSSGRSLRKENAFNLSNSRRDLADRSNDGQRDLVGSSSHSADVDDEEDEAEMNPLEALFRMATGEGEGLAYHAIEDLTNKGQANEQPELTVYALEDEGDEHAAHEGRHDGPALDPFGGALHAKEAAEKDASFSAGNPAAPSEAADTEAAPPADASTSDTEVPEHLQSVHLTLQNYEDKLKSFHGLEDFNAAQIHVKSAEEKDADLTKPENVPVRWVPPEGDEFPPRAPPAPEEAGLVYCKSANGKYGGINKGGVILRYRYELTMDTRSEDRLEKDILRRLETGITDALLPVFFPEECIAPRSGGEGRSLSSLRGHRRLNRVVGIDSDPKDFPLTDQECSADGPLSNSKCHTVEGALTLHFPQHYSIQNLIQGAQLSTLNAIREGMSDGSLKEAHSDILLLRFLDSSYELRPEIPPELTTQGEGDGGGGNAGAIAAGILVPLILLCCCGGCLFAWKRSGRDLDDLREAVMPRRASRSPLDIEYNTDDNSLHKPKQERKRKKKRKSKSKRGSRDDSTYGSDVDRADQMLDGFAGDDEAYGSDVDRADNMLDGFNAIPEGSVASSRRSRRRKKKGKKKKDKKKSDWHDSEHIDERIERLDTSDASRGSSLRHYDAQGNSTDEDHTDGEHTNGTHGKSTTTGSSSTTSSHSSTTSSDRGSDTEGSTTTSSRGNSKERSKSSTSTSTSESDNNSTTTSTSDNSTTSSDDESEAEADDRFDLGPGFNSNFVAQRKARRRSQASRGKKRVTRPKPATTANSNIVMTGQHAVDDEMSVMTGMTGATGIHSVSSQATAQMTNARVPFAIGGDDVSVMTGMTGVSGATRKAGNTSGGPALPSNIGINPGGGQPYVGH